MTNNKEWTIISVSPDGEHSRDMSVMAEDKKVAREMAENYNTAVAEQETHHARLAYLDDDIVIQPYEVKKVSSG